MHSLTPLQSRVIGVMLEKEITTPDQYPLSLNGITVACNQKSNREPVTHLSEQDVQNLIDELVGLKLINQLSIPSSRVPKFKHRFCNTEFGDLTLNEQQLAVICVLLLRGPQTPGELRTRTNRLAEFADVNEVESTLISLQTHNGDVLVKKLAREPGKRESRYLQMFTTLNSDAIAFDHDDLDTGRLSPSDMSDNDASDDILSNKLHQRVTSLETEVKALKSELTQLKIALGVES